MEDIHIGIRTMFLQSIRQVCPKYSLLFPETADSTHFFHHVLVEGSQQIPTHDINIVVANVIFWHAYRAEQSKAKAVATVTTLAPTRKRTRRQRDATDPVQTHLSSPRTITIVSDYGTSTQVTARALGEKLLHALPMESIVASLVADIRLSEGNSGIIHIVTMAHFRAQGENNFMLCPTCGKFLRGEQGLWWHQKMVHGIDHTRAKEVAAAQVSSAALVPYIANSAITIGSSGGVSSSGDDTDAPLKTAAAATAATNDDGEKLPPQKLSRRSTELQLLAPGMEAAKSGDLDTLRTLVEGSAWDAKNQVDRVHGSTALLWAAGGGHLNVCKYLIEECGADPESRQIGRRSFGGRTALHWAARRGHVEVCRWLIEHEKTSVPVDSLTDDGTTPFCWCCWQGHVELATYFVLQKCNPHIINKHGCNVTMWAVQGVADVRLLLMLRDLGCAFLLQNSNGHGCMHKAAQRGKKEVAEWLVKHVPGMLNAQNFGRDGEGYRPSGLAEVEGHLELGNWLQTIEASLGLTQDSLSSW